MNPKLQYFLTKVYLLVLERINKNILSTILKKIIRFNIFTYQ